MEATDETQEQKKRVQTSGFDVAISRWRAGRRFKLAEWYSRGTKGECGCIATVGVYEVVTAARVSTDRSPQRTTRSVVLIDLSGIKQRRCDRHPTVSNRIQLFPIVGFQGR